MSSSIRARGDTHTHTQKLTPKAREGKLCGYSTGSRAYRVYNPTMKGRRKAERFTFMQTPPHNVTNQVGNFYLQDVLDYVFAKLAECHHRHH